MPEPSVLQVFVFRDGEYVGSEIFTEEEIVIGQGDGVDLSLDDPAVASNHAILSHSKEQATLLDLGAPAGTRINRAPIQHSYVTPRDEIQIGSHTLKIKFMTSKRPSLSPRPSLADDLKGDEPTQLQRPVALPSIDDLLAADIARDITASIEISGSDVVAARPVSGVHTPKDTHRTAPRPQPKRAAQPAPAGPKARSAPVTKPMQRPVGHPADTEDLDEEELEEWIRPGFSLLEKLRDAERKIQPGPALEVIGFAGDDVRSAVLLARKGRREALAGVPGLARLNGDGTAEIQFPIAADGWIESQGRRIPLDSLKVPQNAVSKKGDFFRTTLARGSTAVIQQGGSGSYLRFVTPLPRPRESFSVGFDGFIAKAVFSSFVVHAMVLVTVALFSEGVSYSDVPREEWAQIRHDDLRDVEIEPEPEPEPPPMVEEPVVEEAPAEPEPEPPPRPEVRPPKEKKPPKRRGAPPKGRSKQEIKTAGVLGAMGKLNLKGPGRKSMVTAVSNIDAVQAPGGSNFRVGAMVGKIPSSEVSVGGGGGGKILTRGGAELLKGGNGFAQIGKQSGAKVRGSVDRISSSRVVAKGSISREEVAAVINKHLQEVQYCYEKTLLKDPGLQGKLVLEWTINANGSVGRVKQKTSTLRNPAVSKCIIDGLKRWSFPKPRGGLVIVSYPFVFSSVGF